MSKYLKVAFLLTEFPALSETFVLNQITGLLDRGHDVSIFAAQSRAEPARHRDVTGYHLLDRTHYWSSRSYLEQPRILQEFDRSLPTVRRLFRDCFARHIEGRHAFDVALCHFGTNGLRALALQRAGVLSAKIATVFHGYDLSGILSVYGDTVYRRLFATGDCFLPISEHWKSRLMELGCPAERICVHRMGIDPDQFQYIGRSRDDGEPVRFASVARLFEKKGIQHAVPAFHQFVRDHPEIAATYTIIGDGPLRRDLQALARQGAGGEFIEFAGSKQSEEVAATLSKAHIFVAPSVTAANGDQEGIPVAIMEAMATGMPVISTFHSGIPELVEDGISGFLVPERDNAALAKRMYEVAAQPGRWVDIGAAARARVAARHNIHQLNGELEKTLLAVSESERLVRD